MNRTAKTALFAAAAMAAAPFGPSAMDWPMQPSELAVSFGQNGGGRPASGSDLVGEGPVRAAEAGEVVFVRGPEAGIDGFPSPLGSWVAVDHGNGMLGIYARTEASGERRLVEKGAPLGPAGSTGWSESRGVHFSLYDRLKRRWVNPSSILTPRPDRRPPVIRTVFLQAKDGRRIDVGTVRSVRQGEYRVLVEAVDFDDASAAVAPQRMAVSLDGMEKGALHLETLSARDGDLALNEGIPAKAAYAADGSYDIAEIRLSRGKAVVEITARDAAGNEKAALFSLSVE